MHTDSSSLSLCFFNCDDFGSHLTKTHQFTSQQIRILHKTNKKNILVNCWPSEMYVHSLYTQYLVGAHFALITASIRRGMEVISLWQC